MKKSIVAKTFVVFILFFSFAFCFAKSKKEVRPLCVACLDGPTGIPTAYLMENCTKLDKLPVTYQKFATPNQLLAKLLAQEIDIGFLPPNVAAKAFNATNGKIINIGVAGEGMLFLVTKQEGIKDLSQLKGKTVAVAGAASTPDYLFRYILSKNGLQPEDVSLDFSLPTNQIAPALVAGKIEYAVIPEPFASVACTKDKAIYKAFNLQLEYQKITGLKNFPMTLLVTRADFAKNNKKTIQAFQRAYNTAQTWTKANAKDAAALCQKYNFGLQEGVIKMAIPNIAFCYAPPIDSKAKVEGLLQIFLDFSATSVGGKLPSSDFYFK